MRVTVLTELEMRVGQVVLGYHSPHRARSESWSCGLWDDHSLTELE